MPRKQNTLYVSCSSLLVFHGSIPFLGYLGLVSTITANAQKGGDCHGTARDSTAHTNTAYSRNNGTSERRNARERHASKQCSNDRHVCIAWCCIENVMMWCLDGIPERLQFYSPRNIFYQHKYFSIPILLLCIDDLDWSMEIESMTHSHSLFIYCLCH